MYSTILNYVLNTKFFNSLHLLVQRYIHEWYNTICTCTLLVTTLHWLVSLFTGVQSVEQVLHRSQST